MQALSWKPLACLAVILALASLSAPASATVRLVSPHSSAGPQVIHGKGRFGRDGSELVRLGGGFVPGHFAPQVVRGDDQAPQGESDLSAALLAVAPAARCPSETPVAAPRSGPHIIYIGHQPTIHGPKVIYGTN